MHVFIWNKNKSEMKHRLKMLSWKILIFLGKNGKNELCIDVCKAKYVKNEWEWFRYVQLQKSWPHNSTSSRNSQ